MFKDSFKNRAGKMHHNIKQWEIEITQCKCRYQGHMYQGASDQGALFS